MKKRTQEQTTPLLILEDHELRLRYIEGYINEKGDSLFDKRNINGLYLPKKRAGDKLTPLLILQDHESRIRNIESYIKNGYENNYDDQYQNNYNFINDSNDSNIISQKDVLTPKITNMDVNRSNIKKDVDNILISSKKSADNNNFKNEIVLILNRIGELLNQMR